MLSASYALMEGGSGYQSLDPRMPRESPERYEAGTLPTPAIVGLLEGIREVKRIGMDSIHRHVCALNSRLLGHLQTIPGIRVYAPHCMGSVLLFNMEGIEADRLGDLLNRKGFCLRTGFHCAALAHETLGTGACGAVRVSPGLFNTPTQMDHLAEALISIKGKN